MGLIRRKPQAASVDVLMLIEGTYPMIPGGVSEWVHATISSLSDTRFGIVFIGGDESQNDAPHYALPSNVVHLEHHYIADTWKSHRHWSKRRLALNAIIDRLPQAGIVHALSTGFAGALATLLKQRRNDAVLLSEHGIYTRERTIDLARSAARSNESGHHSASLDDNDGRRVWIKYFEALGTISYRHADSITALHTSNRAWQLTAGAPQERSRVVANGIDVSRFERLRDERPETVPRVVAFIGRVVPIKDIKTFIRSIALMRQSDPEIVGWVVGPVDQDPQYADECLALVRSLGQGRRNRAGERALRQEQHARCLPVALQPLLSEERLMSGIGFELHRLLRTERRQHRAAAARQSHNRASTQWLPPIAMLGSAGVLTMLTLGRSDHLEHVTGLFIALVTVSLLACAIPTAAIARIASDPQAPLVRPLVIANLSATALAMLCLLLLWPTLARVFDLSVSQPAAMSATLLANVWPPVVALLLRRQARHAALPVALGAIMLLAVWLVLQRSVQIDPPHSIDLLFYLGLVATVYGIVLGLSFRLDDNARSQPGTPSSRLSHADQPAASMLHAAAPALIATLCVAPALWYLVKWLEPSLCHYRAELMRAVYEGESLEHIEQQLSTFTTESVLGLNTLAKILGRAVSRLHGHPVADAIAGAGLFCHSRRRVVVHHRGAARGSGQLDSASICRGPRRLHDRAAHLRHPAPQSRHLVG